MKNPVYFTSQALRGAEERYPSMEKLAFALITAAHKLKPYFQAHTVIVFTNKPLRRAIRNPEAAEWMTIRVIKLSEFDIQYCPRTAIKGQVIANFIAEFTHTDEQGAEENPQWSVYMDGSSNRQAGGAGVVIHSSEVDEIKCMVRLDFPTTNNEAEYEALIAGLDLAQVAGAMNVFVHCDSQVVTNQVNGDYECRGERMKKYLEQVKNQMNNLHTKFIQIPREENEHANRRQGGINRAHALPRSSTLSCSGLTFVKHRQCVEDKFQEQLDDTNNLLPKG
ncbi:uncharacterized protein LOC142612067 [Castanea sativa]|uniref:uncharacterized protein LOC142612067 n=1 Tax=Castanea sativa TaxID=21020 RepID=UPI003F65074C